jgi:GDP-mannose 6-dehydrogenase
VKLSVFGLGYVGCVSAACLADAGNEVIGVDVNPTKVEIINGGRSPIVEAGINELIAQVVKAGRLTATTDSARAIRDSDLSLVCVGTPSNQNGSLHLRHVEQVCRGIGSALKSKATRHVVVIRSTMLPGTIQNTVVPALEETSGKKAGTDFGICINPEFLREGSSLKDYYSPPFTLIGADDEDTVSAVRSLYSNIDAPVFVMKSETSARLWRSTVMK